MNYVYKVTVGIKNVSTSYLTMIKLQQSVSFFRKVIKIAFLPLLDNIIIIIIISLTIPGRAVFCDKLRKLLSAFERG